MTRPQARLPQELDRLIQEHKERFGDEPRLISIRDSYYIKNYTYYNGRVHTLCCGKGALYAGIPCIITASPFVDDFLIGY